MWLREAERTETTSPARLARARAEHAAGHARQTRRENEAPRVHQQRRRRGHARVRRAPASTTNARASEQTGKR